MNSLMLDDNLLLNDDIEARREHERYQCAGVNLSFQAFDIGNSAISCEPETAEIKDISLNGLAIQTRHALKKGELLSVEIKNPLHNDSEKLTVEIMWCKDDSKQQFMAGLKVITDEDIRLDSANDEKPHDHDSHSQIICPSCNETSFFLREISNDKNKPELYHCCRCNHSHQITEVMAFNRELHQQ